MLKWRRLQERREHGRKQLIHCISHIWQTCLLKCKASVLGLSLLYFLMQALPLSPMCKRHFAYVWCFKCCIVSSHCLAPVWPESRGCVWSRGTSCNATKQYSLSQQNRGSPQSPQLPRNNCNIGWSVNPWRKKADDLAVMCGCAIGLPSASQLFACCMFPRNTSKSFSDPVPFLALS